MNKKDLNYMYGVEINKIKYDFLMDPESGEIHAYDGEQMVIKSTSTDIIYSHLVFREPLPAGVNIL